MPTPAPIDSPRAAPALAALGLTLGRLPPPDVVAFWTWAWACADPAAPLPQGLGEAVATAYPDPIERASRIAAARFACSPDFSPPAAL